MTTNMDFTSSDLVLRLVDETQTGEFYPIKTQKCLLRNNVKHEQDGRLHCAIFRGPNGTAIQSRGTSIIVNGKEVESEWLKRGDKIELGDSQFEVYQLGEVANQSAQSSQTGTTSSTQTACISSKTSDSNETCGSNESQFDSNEEDSMESVELDHEWKDRVLALEERIGAIHQQNDSVSSRFDELDSRMAQLTNTLSNLADSIANNTHVAMTAPVEHRQEQEDSFAETFVNEPSEEKFVRESGPTVEYSKSDETEQDRESTPTLQCSLPDEAEIVSESTPTIQCSIPDETGQVRESTPTLQCSLPDEAEIVRESTPTIQCSMPDEAEQVRESTPTVEHSMPDETGRESTATIEYSIPVESEKEERFLSGTSFETNVVSDSETECESSGGTVGEMADDSGIVATEQQADESESNSLSLELERVFGKINSQIDEVESDSVGTKTCSESCSQMEQTSCNDDEEVFVTFSDENSKLPESFDEQTTLTKLDTSEFEHDLGGQLKPISEISEQIEEHKTADDGDSERFNDEATSIATEEAEASYDPIDNETLITQSLEDTLDKALQSISPDLAVDSQSTPEEADQELTDSSPEPKNESVAEILARMQSQGQLDGYSLDDATAEPIQDASAELVQQVHETPVEPTIVDSGNKAGGDEENSVEAYMNRLLGRTGMETKENKSEAVAAQTTQEAKAPETVKNPEPVQLLKPSEYKPAKSAPEKNKNMDAMRELANQTNRVALESSGRRRAKAVIVTNYSIMAIGFGLAAYLLTSSTGSLSDLTFWSGAITLGVSLGMGATATKSLIAIRKT